jgi:hypothetical protein
MSCLFNFERLCLIVIEPRYFLRHTLRSTDSNFAGEDNAGYIEECRIGRGWMKTLRSLPILQQQLAYYVSCAHEVHTFLISEVILAQVHLRF